MITGDTSISSGDVFVNGLRLKTHRPTVNRMTGYCPQFDALLQDLTGSQTLEIFGLLRGYRRKDIPAMSASLAQSLNFTKHIDKKIESYSGGNKRKLSTAIAIMGNPNVVYLGKNHEKRKFKQNYRFSWIECYKILFNIFNRWAQFRHGSRCKA